MEQFLAHLAGDYLLQSHWMAVKKTKESLPCLIHVILYGIPFLIIGVSYPALAVIIGTHFFIDRFRLARYVVYAKNFLSPDYEWSYIAIPIQRKLQPWAKWSECSKTGFDVSVPDYLAVWLLIIVDNTLHLMINYLAIRFL